MEDRLKTRLNEVFSDLYSLNTIKNLKFIESADVKLYDSGVEGEMYKIFLIEDLGIYIKITYKSDSYGDNQSVNSITFVEPIEETKVIYK